MDDILASIRRIIDEDPIEARHRTPRAQGEDRRSGPVVPPLAPLFAPLAPHELQSTLNQTPVAVVRSQAIDDDVLAELLAPAPSAPAGTSQSARPRVVVQPIVQDMARLDVVEAAVPVASVEEALIGVETAPIAASLPIGVPTAAAVTELQTVAALPRTDAPSAEDVLAELARGLTFFAPSVAAEPVAVAPTFEAPATVDLVATDTVAADLDPQAVLQSPAEAVAAAVAAVAAVNAVAAQSGTRPRAATVEAPPFEGAHVELEPVLSAPVPVAINAEEIAPPPLPAPVVAALPFEMAALPEIADAPVAAVPDAPSPTVSISSPLVPQPAATFEDAISTMLRPLLRDWLDDNMPRMVEKALKEEIAGAGGIVTQTAKLARPDAA